MLSRSMGGILVVRKRSLTLWGGSGYRRYPHSRYRVEHRCWRDFQASLDSTRRLQIEGFAELIRPVRGATKSRY